MASKQIKATTVVHTPTEQAHRVWLAGLGALSLSYKQGSEWLARFIAEGRDLQTRGTTIAREAVTDLQAQATGVLAPLQVRIEDHAAQFTSTVENGWARLLKRLGIPARRDVEELSAQIATLTRKLKAVK